MRRFSRTSTIRCRYRASASAELPEALDAVIARGSRQGPGRSLRDGGRAGRGRASGAGGRGACARTTAPHTDAAVRTFLFADVRGYTAYTREQGDEAGAALAHASRRSSRGLAPEARAGTSRSCAATRRSSCSTRRGRRCASRSRCAENVEADELPRPVGIGLDAGEAVPVEEGFRGGALNRAARLCALARPGEVLPSDAVVELAGKADGVAYGFRRTERLKGFEKPVGVVEIHPAAAARGASSHGRCGRRLLGTRPRRRLGIYGVSSPASRRPSSVSRQRRFAPPSAPPRSPSSCSTPGTARSRRASTPGASSSRS